MGICIMHTKQYIKSYKFISRNITFKTEKEYLLTRIKKIQELKVKTSITLL